MKRMESDATTVRVEDRVRQQMVKIDDHGQQHNPPRPPPAIPEKQPGNPTGNEHMEQKVDFDCFEKVCQFRTRHAFDLEASFE